MLQEILKRTTDYFQRRIQNIVEGCLNWRCTQNQSNGILLIEK